MTDKFSSASSMVIQASPAKVWEALTTPSMVKQWLFGTEVVTDWKKGSPIFYRGEWEGKPYEDKGVILEIEPEKKFLSTYWSKAFGEDVPENYQNVGYILEPQDGGTKLTITQDNIPNEKTMEHSKKNWDTVLESLKKLLEKA